MSSDYRHLEKTFEAHIESLDPILTWLRGYCKDTGFVKPVWNKIEIAIEEALVNIINHAYHPEKCGWIFLSFYIYPSDRIEFVIKDMGKPFNPEKGIIKRPKCDNIDLTPIGGLGIMLMHSYMDEIRYERVDPYNVLTLVKYCESIHQ